jgi:hypothetical protein
MATEIVSEDPLTPRVWNDGDAEPTDCKHIHDKDGDGWSRYFDGWSCGSSAVQWKFLIRNWGPITEVLADTAAVA